LAEARRASTAGLEIFQAGPKGAIEGLAPTVAGLRFELDIALAAIPVYATTPMRNQPVPTA